MLKSQKKVPDTFLYFAYGANILPFKMHMDIPSAKFVSIGRVDNYRMDFIKYSKYWGGPTGTLVPTGNAHTWGVIWRLDKSDEENLDNHKDVEEKKYYIHYLTVHTPHKGDFICRVYIQKVNPLPRGDKDPIPAERWPSWSYMHILILGAAEQGLPEYYIDYLKKIKDNGEEGCIRVHCLLSRYAMDPPCECRVPGRIPRKPLKLDVQKIRNAAKNK